MDIKLILGNKIYFAEEKRPYTVKACNDRFVVCTKPFNLKHTVLYTIVDLKEKIRGTNNLIFNSYDYSVQEDIEDFLNDLQLFSDNKELNIGLSISHKNRIPLNIIKIK